ncbi:MAG: sigma-70 family RNA polymerase sigma factor [Verrucomicrobiota bacterium]
MTERDLVRRYLRKGDLGAARELFGRYEEGLYRYLWQMLRHQQDSEDALQDTFRKALQALPRYREESHFKSWLFRIGHNTALDLIRRRKKVVEMSEGQEEGLAAGGVGPLEALEAREQVEELRRAVAKLPDAEREVVSLRMQADLSFAEIAKVLGAPLGTVLARMHKAKQRLRTQLAAI